MKEEKAALEGIIPPLPTPFTEDGEIDAEALRRMAGHLRAGGVDAVFVAGTAGLAPLLTERQYGRLMELALECFREGPPLVAGVIECSTPRALERIHLLESLGYRRFVLTSTFYLPPSGQRQALRHFGRCAEATELEMIVYNIPSCTGIHIAVETVEEMARRGWTRTVKDSSNDAAHFGKLCALGRDAGLAIFQGLRPVMSELAALGAAGCVPVPGNIRPSIFAEAWKAARNGDAERVRTLQVSIDLLWETLVAPGDFLTGTLYALARERLMQELLPEPLEPASEERRRVIDETLARTKGIR